jgi:putative phage-type endonuclease
MKIIELKEKTPEWHAWRKGGIGSSDIAAIVGKSPFKTARDIFEIKKGRKEETFLNPAIIRGIEYESEAREEFNRHLSASFSPVCCEHTKYSYMRASLDGYDSKLGKCLEIKIPYPNVLEKIKEGVIPEHYYLQCQWQLFVSDKESLYFDAYVPETKETFYIPIERNEDMIKYLMQEAELFWDNFLQDIAPPLQATDYIFIENPELKKAQEKYIKNDQIKKEIDKEQKELKEFILDFGDGGNFKTDRLTVFWKEGREVLDKNKMIQDGIDINLYLKKGSPYPQINIQK